MRISVLVGLCAVLLLEAEAANIKKTDYAPVYDTDHKDDYSSDYGSDQKEDYNSDYGGDYQDDYTSEYGDDQKEDYTSDYGSDYQDDYKPDDYNSGKKDYKPDDYSSGKKDYKPDDYSSGKKDYKPDDYSSGKDYTPEYGSDHKDDYTPEYGSEYTNDYTPEYSSEHKDDYTPEYSSGKDYTPEYSSGKDYKPEYSSGKDYKPPYNAGKDYKPPYNAGEDYKPPYNAGKDYKPPYNAGEDYKPPYKAGEDYKPPYNAGEDYKPPYNSGEDYKPEYAPDKDYETDYEDYGTEKTDYANDYKETTDYPPYDDKKKPYTPPPYVPDTTAYLPPDTTYQTVTTYKSKTTPYGKYTPPPYVEAYEKPEKPAYVPPVSYGYSGKYSWGQWEGWLGCSVSCGTGLQSRRRQCNPYGGGAYDKPAGGRYVRAASAAYQPPKKYADKPHPSKLPAPIKEETYYIDPVVVPDPNVPYYSEDFQNVYEFPEGYDSSDDQSGSSYGCDGEGSETRTCRLDPCAVNGGWTAWTTWTLCSVSCGEGGIQVRNRSCENPIPAYGGRFCRGVYSEIVTCSVPRVCPTDGGWSQWTPWSRCSITCGYGGTVYRGRTCTAPTPAYGGATCDGDSRQTNGCCDGPCPIDGAWSSWSEWTEPSVTCGSGGTSRRFRRCDNPERAFGGKACFGNDTEVKYTHLTPCPINGAWCPWSDWGKCSITCGAGGYQTRSRTCDKPSPDYGGKLCKGDALQAQVCSGQPCAIPGGWSNWFEWSICSATCGFGGLKSRRRICNHPAPLYDGEQCEGDSFDSVSCFIKHCPINGAWSPWTEWSFNAVAIGVRTNPMDNTIPEESLDILRTRTGDRSGQRGTITYPTGTSTGSSVQTIVPNIGGLGLGPDVPGVTCGYNGTKTRYRVCDNPEPQFGGRPCDGEAYETISVPLPPCPVNGGWASWSEWTPNSVTCGDGGVSTRDRQCSNPTPAFSGANCVGAYTELKSVPAPACPVCGGWTGWSDWSDCSASCGYEGITSRSRSCTNPSPANDGDKCEGESAQTTGCATQPCPICGAWGSWNEWSLCSANCGPGGFTDRRRYCDTPAPLYGGTPCEGEGVESKPCVGPSCPVNGSWSEWNSWSKATVSCGEGGTQTRTRTCTEPAPAYGGRSCRGYPTETKAVVNAPCATDGGWSSWSTWSSSGQTCGQGGTNTRNRDCTNPAPSTTGRPCKGEAVDVRYAPNPPCPVNGGWNQWSSYSSCNVPCGDGGFVYRTRVCDKPAPAHNGSYCPGPSSESLSCSSRPCPIHGNWARWSEWSSSTATCGYGVVTRGRNCNAPSPANGGDQCDGVSSESKVATIPECPINGLWTSWSEWSQCSVSCGDAGKTQRARYCEAPEPQYGGRSCDGEGLQIKPCPAPSCGVDGGWTEWQAWSKCSVSCGDGGFVTRVRTCTNPTPSAGGRYCKGLSSETRPGRAPPCPIDGGWGAWARWSSCSISCGVGGYVQRSRACDYPTPQYGGKDCIGDRVNTKNCTAPYCAIDGGWSSWQEWTRPDVSCGEGSINRRRICDSPAAQYGGKPCAEDAVETKRYVGPACPTDGGWSSWGEWSKPTSTCGNDGFQSRTRKCDNPSPANNGRNCHGVPIETKPIPLPRCAVDGGWNAWNEWSLCSVTCGFGGVATRSRRCDLPKPANGGKLCNGDIVEKRSCYSSPCPVDGGWTSWSQWSKCSVTCGDGGTATRSRSCDNPEAAYGGRACSGIAQESKSCSATPCAIDGAWSAWAEWSSCSVTCGEKGIVSRNRRCDRPTPSYAGRNCPGLSFESKNCTAPPCSVDGGWGDWGAWSRGSLSCGHGGMATRQRGCVRPSPLYGGQNCKGAPTETKYVFEKPCDNWTPWTTWSDCIQKCGVSPYKKRVRDCRLVKGQVYGKYIEEYCEGEPVEFFSCVKPHVYGSSRTTYQLDVSGVSLRVPCLHDWIVVLHRDSDALSFNRTWAEYKKGFGNCEGNFFIGLDALHKLTKDGKYKLRYEVQTAKGGKWYNGEYKRVVIGSEDDLYTLNVENYAGDAGDMAYENGMPFTTIDRDNDKSTYSNCAKTSCGGWWYNACYQVNLAGDYKRHFMVKALAPDQYLKVATIMIQREPDQETPSDTYGRKP